MANERWYRILVSICSVIVMLLILEGGARLLYQGQATLYWELDPILLWKLKPNQHLVHAAAGNVPIDINSKGLRDDEFSTQKPSGVYRILVLGDSITFGWGVRVEETYVQQLEHLLNASFPFRRFEVINAGVPAYDTGRELAFLKKEGLSYEPDLVIVGFWWNDLYPTVFANEKEKSNFFRDAQIREMLRHSAFLTLLKIKLIDRIQPIRFGVFDHSTLLHSEGNNNLEQRWARLVRPRLDELVDVARQAGSDVMVVEFPALLTEQPLDTLPELHTWMEKWGEENRAKVVDPLPAILKGYRESGASNIKDFYWVSSQDPHPSAAVYKIVAEQLFEALTADSTLTSTR